MCRLQILCKILKSRNFNRRACAVMSSFFITNELDVVSLVRYPRFNCRENQFFKCGRCRIDRTFAKTGSRSPASAVMSYVTMKLTLTFSNYWDRVFKFGAAQIKTMGTRDRVMDLLHLNWRFSERD